MGCGDDGGGASDTDGGVGGDGSGSSDTDGGTSEPGVVTLTLTNRPTNATLFSFLVAYQDGNAAWQLAPAPTGDKYSFMINAPSYGVAFTCIANIPGMNASQSRTVTTAHFAVGERNAITLDVPSRCSDRSQGLVTLSGNVSNRPASGVLVVQFGTRTAFVGTQTGNFTLQTPPGTRDLIVSHAVPEGNGEYYVDETLVVRDLAVTGATTRTLDFTNAVATDFYPVTVDAPNARVIASTTLYTANGTTASLVRESANWETDSLATSQRRTTDVYDQSIAVSTLGQGATVTHATNTVGEQTYVAPAALGTVMATVPTKTPYVTLQSTWPAYANAVGYLWTASQTGGCTNMACTTTWFAYVSPGVSGTQPGFRMPDLAGLTGWKKDFELTSGQPAVGSVTAITSSAGAGDFPTGIPAAGTNRAFVRSDYGLTP